MSGGHQYSSRYAKYKSGDVSDSDFTSYVDSRGDLANAWDMINAYQTKGDMSKFKTVNGLTPSQQADYWIKRGANTKAAFGRAHAAEDADLFNNTYQGATKYKVGSKAWNDYFKDKDGTYFDTWKKTKDKVKEVPLIGETGPEEGTGTNWSPLMDFVYEAPTVTKASGYMPDKMSGIWGDNNLSSLLYNPGTKGYDKSFKTSKYMDWDPVEVESGVPSFGSRFTSFDLPADWESNEDADKKKKKKKHAPEGGADNKTKTKTTKTVGPILT